MSEAATSDLNFTGPWENPDTPGFHKAMVGGGIGPFGQTVSLCAKCGALLLDHDESRRVHTEFHETVRAVAAWLVDNDPKIRRLAQDD